MTNGELKTKCESGLRVGLIEFVLSGGQPLSSIERESLAPEATAMLLALLGGNRNETEPSSGLKISRGDNLHSAEGGAFDQGCELRLLLSDELPDDFRKPFCDALPDAGGKISMDVEFLSRTDDWFEGWAAFASNCDHVLLIAPEIDGIYANLARRLGEKGVPLLNSDLDFLVAAGDKWTSHCLWRAAGLPFIPTVLASEATLARMAQQAQSGATEDRNCLAWGESDRFVMKPRRSTGGLGVEILSVAEREERRRKSFAKSPSCDSVMPSQTDTFLEDLILQNEIEGEFGSICCLCWQSGRIWFPATLQNFSCQLGQPERFYVGGVVGYFGEIESDLRRLADSAIDALPGEPRGWIGVDFVRTRDSVLVVEINARITTSILGISKAYHQFSATFWRAMLGEAFHFVRKSRMPFDFRVDSK